MATRIMDTYYRLTLQLGSSGTFTFRFSSKIEMLTFFNNHYESSSGVETPTFHFEKRDLVWNDSTNDFSYVDTTLTASDL